MASAMIIFSFCSLFHTYSFFFPPPSPPPPIIEHSTVVVSALSAIAPGSLFQVVKADLQSVTMCE